MNKHEKRRSCIFDSATMNFSGPEILFPEDKCFYYQDFKFCLLLHHIRFHVPKGQERSCHPTDTMNPDDYEYVALSSYSGGRQEYLWQPRDPLKCFFGTSVPIRTVNSAVWSQQFEKSMVIRGSELLGLEVWITS